MQIIALVGDSLNNRLQREMWSGVVELVVPRSEIIVHYNLTFTVLTSNTGWWTSVWTVIIFVHHLVFSSDRSVEVEMVKSNFVSLMRRLNYLIIEVITTI